MSEPYLANVEVLIAEATKRGISVAPLGARNVLLLTGFGTTARLFGTITDRTSHLAVKLADDKRATKRLLALHRLPTPASYPVDVEDEAVNAHAALGGVVAIKPHNGAQGRGVSVNVRTESEVRHAFRQATRVSRIVLVEEHVSGRDYRVFIVDGMLVAAAERRAPHVVGDGSSSIHALISAENQSSLRGDGDERPLTRILVDDRVDHCLRGIGKTLSTVPACGEVVVLNPIGSVSLGSSSFDFTDEIHPEIAALAIEAASVVGLDIAGVDVIARDASLPVKDGGAQIIEVNCSPGLRAHLYPSAGAARNPAIPIFDYLFPLSRGSAPPGKMASGPLNA